MKILENWSMIIADIIKILLEKEELHIYNNFYFASSMKKSVDKGVWKKHANILQQCVYYYFLFILPISGGCYIPLISPSAVKIQSFHLINWQSYYSWIRTQRHSSCVRSLVCPSSVQPLTSLKQRIKIRIR